MARAAHAERQRLAYEAAMAWKRGEPVNDNRVDAHVASVAEVREPPPALPPKPRQLPDLTRYGWFGHGGAFIVCEACRAEVMGRLAASRCLPCALKLHDEA
jgi:hypothetical protein